MAFNLKIPFYKRIFSYFIPVFLISDSSPLNEIIALYLYKNQLQLATDLVLYSDGNRYMPFRLTFKELQKEKLQNCKNILILGGGLGSIAQILHSYYFQENRHFSIVEIDEKIAKWGAFTLNQKKEINADFIIDDAFHFILNTQLQFDLICIDVFIDRNVPVNIKTEQFLKVIKEQLLPGGIWVMNYVINHKLELKTLQNTLNLIFPKVEMVCRNQNVVFYGQVKA